MLRERHEGKEGGLAKNYTNEVTHWNCYVCAQIHLVDIETTAEVPQESSGGKTIMVF